MGWLWCSLNMYIKVKNKLGMAMLFSAAWFALAFYLAIPWARDLAGLVSTPVAWFIVTGLALIPGVAMSFIVAALILDHRPEYSQVDKLLDVSILIAAYNEEEFIEETLESICRQDYTGHVEVIVIDDGSQDATYQVASDFIARNHCPVTFKTLRVDKNAGKANALNLGLQHASHDLLITVDADSFLYKDALVNIVTNLLAGPPNTAAVAGTVLVRNSRENLITRIQEWDYFHGIAVIKRIQSLFQGTLVAQGAFSVYRKEAIKEVGGWPDTVGEDIVLTWGLQEKGYRVGYAENAFVFTNVPDTYGRFFRQRKRWSRGLMEAFRQHSGLLKKIRLNTIFVWLNLTFPYIDMVYLFVFLPGLIAAIFFKFYAIVGLMTILLLPLALLINWLVYLKQVAIFRSHGLHVRQNLFGFTFYLLAYQAIMSPACVFGYLSELVNARKSW